MEFTIRLAGIPIGVQTIYEETRRMCGSYLCGESARFSVVSTRELIDAERERASRDGYTHTDAAYMETLVVYRLIAEKMAEHDVLLFHGSAVSVDGHAFLFTADSGTGKSTHARLWREALPKFGHEVLMVNDDKPLLKFTEDGVLACGTPWDGKHHLSNNLEVPLRGICFLSRGKENRITRVDGAQSLAELMKHSFRPVETPHLLKAVALLDRLSREVPLYDLSCNMEEAAAIVSYEGMCGL